MTMPTRPIRSEESSVRDTVQRVGGDDQGRVNEYYDAIAPGYDELHRLEQLPKYALLARMLAEQGVALSSARVLDVGAGTGVGCAVIPSVGVDPSQGLLARHPHPDSVVAPAEALPFPDASFDVVISVTALHHADVSRAFSEMRRVSRGPVAFSILKRSSRAPGIAAYARSFFSPLVEAEEERDIVFVHVPPPRTVSNN